MERNWFRERCVLTTDGMARALGVRRNRLHKNFQRHAAAFVEGVHYFALSGGELRSYKEEKGEDKFAAVLYLWTAEGVRLQAETLRDVGQVRAVWEQLLAWEVAR